ncbi:MAG: DUF111 family protein [Burkholderiales bacterium]|nr:DUF111 family protein [Burkholderiales bacterium]
MSESAAVLLLLAQVDDAPGELLGEVMQRLAAIGAKNVQLLSSLAKKGRPGYVLLIDILAPQETEVAALLAGELGIWGYRVLHSDHKHFDIERHDTTLEVDVGGSIRAFPMRIKRILIEGELLRVKAEHDDLSHVCAALGAEGTRLSLSAIKSRVESAVGTAVPDGSIRIALDRTERMS